MITTLENLTEKVRKNRLKNLATNIVKYQNFKTSAIINKIDNCGYTKSSLYSYINFGIAYIKNGSKNKQAGNIYEYIDEAIKNCVQPLTPAYNEHRLTLKRRPQVKENATLPVQKVLGDIYEKASTTKSVQFGIMNKDNLRVFLDKEDALNFKNSLLFFGGNNAKLVQVVIKEL